jgi:hypothetical protein
MIDGYTILLDARIKAACYDHLYGKPVFRETRTIELDYGEEKYIVDLYYTGSDWSIDNCEQIV